MSVPQDAPIFKLLREGTVETIHYGALAVVDAPGELVAWWGDPYAVTYLRSSAKLLQMLPVLECGGGARFDLSLKEIALMCASHAGTDEHVAVLRGIQAKTGVQESDFLCGVHPLGDKPTIEAMRQRGDPLTPNRNNCSGDVAGEGDPMLR